MIHLNDYGNTQPGDDNFADVVAIDADILEVLAERERQKEERRECPSACQILNLSL